MKKDAYWFSHDSNAKDDPKCVLLIEQLGLEGYGIYWVLIETLRDQPNYKYPINLLPAIARRYNSTFEKVKTVVLNYGLFKIENEEFFFTYSLMERMQSLDNKRLQASEAGKISALKKKQALNDRSTYVKQALNDRSTIKEDESKVKDISEIFNFKKCFLNLGVTENVLNDWLLVRKNKNATNSETAANDILKQISISGLTANECIKIAAENSWSGFKKNWYDNTNKNTQPTNSDLCPEMLKVIELNPTGKWIDDIYIVDNAHRWKKNGFKLVYQ